MGCEAGPFTNVKRPTCNKIRRKTNSCMVIVIISVYLSNAFMDVRLLPPQKETKYSYKYVIFCQKSDVIETDSAWKVKLLVLTIVST